jgi:radical SAM protein with 4Fe4S-binding SPASM domain
MLEPLFNFSREDVFINFRFWNGPHQSLIKKICERFSVPVPTTFEKNYRLKKKTFLHFDERFTWPHMKSSSFHEEGFCHALSSHFGILVDGSVVPCCLDSGGEMVLGSVVQESIRNILKSPRALNIRNSFLERKICEELCKHCEYIEKFNNKY